MSEKEAPKPASMEGYSTDIQVGSVQVVVTEEEKSTSGPRAPEEKE